MLVFGAAGSGIRPSNDNASRNTKKSESKSEVEIVREIADRLRLRQLREGVYIIEHEFRRGKKLAAPIELIGDPVIADRVRKGLRPDGKPMYTYPKKLPKGYPSEWLVHAIDIYPMKVNTSEGSSIGYPVLHGHLLDPPYKFQVVVLGEEDVRILINGIDTKLRFLPSEYEKRLEERRDRHRRHMRALKKRNDALPPDHPNKQRSSKIRALKRTVKILYDLYSPKYGLERT